MRRDYYLHKRKNGFYYVEFTDKVTGSKLPAKSTGESELIKAQVKAEQWLINGVPTGRMKKPRPIEQAAGIEGVLKAIRKTELNSDDALRIVDTLKKMELIDIVAVKNTGQGAVPFTEFLQTFWDFDKSEYIQSELDHGKRFTRRHAYECMNRVKAELIPFFGDKKMNCVTIDDLDLLARQLRLRGLATSTINQITLIARKALKWAYEKKIISENPCLGFTKFSIENKERGILNEKEITALFATNWTDKRAYVASLLSASTGARQGECLALRLSDIDGDFVNIDHGYSPFDGIKCTKTGKKRRVKMIPVTKAALMDLLKDNPHVGNENTTPDYDPFFFYSMQPDKPCDCKILLKGLKDAMDKVNAKYKKAAEKEGREKPEISIDYRKRNIIFHSWRHYFCTIADNEADMKKVKKVSGHLSDGVFNKYADHIDERDIVEVGNVIEKAFDNIISFRKAG